MKRTIVSSTIPGFVGDIHRYETEMGIISCVYPCPVTFDKYEIFCVEGNLFDDIERYDTLIEAENRIKELLGVNNFKFFG